MVPEAHVSARVSVSLFGPFIVRIEGRPAPLTITGHTLDLLRYLLIHAGRAVRREHLAELFWPDATEKRRRSTLNTAIWRLRSQLCERCDMQLISEGEAICLETGAGVSVDVHELSSALEAVLGPDAKDCAEARLEQALCASDQPFLDGLTSDWALIAREKYFELRTRALSVMMRRCGELERFEDAIKYGQSLLAEDPFREATHCEVMWLYVLSGRRAQAMRQYERCAAMLRTELDIEPMAELRILYDHIRAGHDEAALCAAAREAPQITGALGSLLMTIERSRRDIYAALCQQLH